jgi:hypothetical protein
VSLNETCDKVHTVKYFCDVLPVKSGLKQEDVSTLFRLKYASIYAIREVRANPKGLKLNGALEILFLGKDANLLGVNSHTLGEGNEEALLVASIEVSSVAYAGAKHEKFSAQRFVKYSFEL